MTTSASAGSTPDRASPDQLSPPPIRTYKGHRPTCMRLSPNAAAIPPNVSSSHTGSTGWLGSG